MSQVIKYTAFTDIFVIYRGGYDPDKKHGLDPYNRKFVKYGFLLYIRSEDKDKAFKIFNIPKDGNDHIVEVDLSICFDEHMRIVVYNNKTVRNVGRIHKLCKTNSPTLKKWGEQYHYYIKEEFPVDVKYWDLKGDDYLICHVTHHYLCHLIPEILDKYPQLADIHENYKESCKQFYLLNPIDLNSSWDYTEEQKYIKEYGKECLRK